MNLDSRESLDLDLNKYVQAVKRHWLLGVGAFVGTVGLFAGLSLTLKPSYMAEGKLLFSEIDETIPWIGVGAETGQLRSLLDSQTPLSTEVEILKSHQLLADVISNLDLKDKNGAPLKVKEFRDDLVVKIVGATDIIMVAYKHGNAQVASDVVNTLMGQYIENDIQKQRSETMAAREFIAAQLPQVEANFLVAESELRQFKEKNQIVDLPQEAQAVVQSLQTLKQQMIEVTSELNGVDAQTAELRKNFRLDLDQAIGVNTLSQSPEVRGALEELAVVERELADARQHFQDTHPTVIALQEKRTLLSATVRNQVIETLGSNSQIPDGLLQFDRDRDSLLDSYIALEIERLSLSNRLSTLERSWSDYARRASLFPRLEETQQQLERKVEVARSTYEALLQRFQDVRIAENKPTSNAEIVVPAIPPEQSSSGRLKVLVGGVLIGLLLASTAILLREISDKSLRSLDQIKKIFPYSILGILPLLKENSSALVSKSAHLSSIALVKNYPNSPVSEVYRAIQANLRFFNIGNHQQKVVLVTSSVPGEGASTVAANLATTISQLGHHVLLIDTNLRTPSQHHLWEVSNTRGLSHVLTGQTELSFEHNDSVESLKILTAGFCSSNPLAIIDSEAMKSLLQSMAAKFDFVIIDSPPLTTTADALTLGKMSDGIVLVARPDVLDSDSAIRAREILESSNQTVLGLVVNGLDKAGAADFTYMENQLHVKNFNGINDEQERLTKPIHTLANSRRI